MNILTAEGSFRHIANKMLLRENWQRSGILLKRRHIVLLIGFLGFIIEIANAATCPTSYGCDIYCQNDTYGCYDCPLYYGLSNPTSNPPFRCSSCGVECFRCTQGLNCTLCRTGYGPIDPWNCGACLTENCYSCPVNRNTCLNCKPGFGFYPNRTTCGACSDYCIGSGCDNQLPGKCDKCDPGYGYTSTNSCEPCSAYCAAGCYVKGAARCDRCDFGYGLAPNESCAACSSYCSAGCNVSGECIQCDSGFGLTINRSCAACSPNCSAGCNGTGAGKCDQCDPGTVRILNGSCAACSPNCNLSIGCDISGAGFCDQCNNGYAWVNASNDKSCAACSLNCAVGCNLTGPGKCDACNTGYEISANGSCSPITTVMPTTTVIPTSHIVAETTGSAQTNTGTINANHNANISTVSQPNPGLGTATGFTANIGTSYSESTTSAARGVTTSSKLRDGDIVVLTLLLLIIGGIIISITVALCWCCRFYPGAKTRRICRTKKKHIGHFAGVFAHIAFCLLVVVVVRIRILQ